jgi:hypothetical protein
VSSCWKIATRGPVGSVGKKKKCLATGWTTGSSRFDPQERQKDFSLWLRRDEDHSPHLVPSLRMSRSYPPLLPSALWHVVGVAFSVSLNYYNVINISFNMTICCD